MQQRIHFVTGKGGVGKSMVAFAMAQDWARQGYKTLLVELGDHSFFQDLLDLESQGKTIGFQPLKIKDNLDLALWTGTECLREYARHLIKVETLTRLFFENPVMRTFINVAPALPELAIMGKLTSTYRKHGPALNYDFIVVDGYATGHFLSLMRAARGMAEAIQFGPMGDQSRSIDQALKNLELCHYHIVTLPEELPLKEASELGRTLQAEFGIEPHYIVNKKINPPMSIEELSATKAEGSMQQFIEYLKFQLSKQEQAMSHFLPNHAKKSLVGLHFESEPQQLAQLIASEINL